MDKPTVYYSDRYGIVVTERYLRTRHKDQALAPITSIRIGREPLFIAAALGAGLLAFAWRFGDLLYLHEAILLTLAGLGLLAGGHSVVSLQMGSYAHERTMLWGTYWTISRIRDAIIEARRHASDNATVTVSTADSE